MEQSIIQHSAIPTLFLPDTGLLRIKKVLKFIDVSKSDWYNGVKTGKYPKSIKDDGKTFWKAEDIRALIAKINNQAL